MFHLCGSTLYSLRSISSTSHALICIVASRSRSRGALGGFRFFTIAMSRLSGDHSSLHLLAISRVSKLNSVRQAAIWWANRFRIQPMSFRSDRIRSSISPRLRATSMRLANPEKGPCPWNNFLWRASALWSLDRISDGKRYRVLRENGQQQVDLIRHSVPFRHRHRFRHRPGLDQHLHVDRQPGDGRLAIQC